ncbi:MAG: hypothetical protein HY332_25880 [Chloroflexi bacterium]|nr:hypothetical protein [Chloroflexota bacterium]
MFRKLLLDVADIPRVTGFITTDAAARGIDLRFVATCRRNWHGVVPVPHAPPGRATGERALRARQRRA